MFCVKCGFDNESEAKICRKCGATLPRYVSEAETQEEPKVESPVVNERLQIFEDAVDKVTTELLSQSFLPVIHFFQTTEEETEHRWLFHPLESTYQ